MKYILIALLLSVSAMAHAQATSKPIQHDPRCYAHGQYDPDLGDDDLDCSNDPITQPQGE